MAEGQTYNIPEVRLEWFRDKIAGLNKKSLKLVGEKVYCSVIGYHFIDGEGHKKLQKMKIFEVFVSHPELKLNGWQFIARIDHSQEAGNVVRVVPGRCLSERYRHSGPICEHCNENRMRRDTFVLNRVGTTEFKQVGTSCLKDFTGHNGAEKLAKMAELLAIIGDYAKGYGFERSGGLEDYRWINAQYYMGLVAQSVIDKGWVSSKTAKERGWTSTRSLAESMMSENVEPSEYAYEIAGAATRWAQEFGEEGQTLNDWEHNSRIVSQSDALEFRHLALAASVVGVYWNKFVRQEQKESNYVGKEGERFTTSAVLKGVFPGEHSVRHVFEDTAGNILLWFGSKSLGRVAVGNEITISMLVKKHQTYNGKKQTLVSRVKQI